MSDQSNSTIIISRMQQRRGLKQNLPQPLRPAELGFTTDSRQVFIGAETETDGAAQLNNRTVRFENVINSNAIGKSLANNNIIKFDVPSKIYPKGTAFSSSWNASTVFRAGTDFKNINTGAEFAADQLFVKVNGLNQTGITTLNNPVADNTFTFDVSASNTHTMSFLTDPSVGDYVSVTYYGRDTVIDQLADFQTAQSIPDYLALNNDLVTVNLDAGTGFVGLESKHIDVIAESSTVSSSLFSNLGNLIVIRDPNDPSGAVTSYAGTVVDINTQTLKVTTSSTIPDLPNISHVWLYDVNSVVYPANTINNQAFLISNANVIANSFEVDIPSAAAGQTFNNTLKVAPALTVDLSGGTSVNDVVSAVEASNSWLIMNRIPDTTTRLYMYSNDGVQFRYVYDPNEASPANTQLAFSVTNFTRADNTVKSKLEQWFDDRVTDSNVNVFTAAYSNEKYAPAGTVTNLGTWGFSENTVLNELTFDTNDEAENFVNTVNTLYYDEPDNNFRGLVTLKNNIEILTSESQLSQTVVTYAAPRVHTAPSGNVEILGLRTPLIDADTMQIEYSMKAASGSGNIFSRTGLISLIANNDANGGTGAAVLNDTSTEYVEGFTGIIAFDAGLSNSTVKVYCENNLSPNVDITMKYIIRRWLS